MSQKKKGFRWWVFQKFGPPEVLSLIAEIDRMTSPSEVTGVAIYPTGDFRFNVRMTDEPNGEPKPLKFATLPERTAFQAGLNFGVQTMGGSTSNLSKEEYELLQEMDRKSTHGGGSGYNN